MLAVINPATGAPFQEAPDSTKRDLDDAIRSARAAFGAWSKSEDQRKKKLADCASALSAQAPALAELLTKEQGKPLREAVIEVKSLIGWFNHSARLELPEVEVLQDDERARIEVHRRPLGVVGAITPWNYPLMLAAWKIAPALRAGNTVVLKPSPYTPLSSLAIGEALRSILPEGALTVLSGGDDLGRWLTEHPGIDKISFTGSIEVGRSVARTAGADLKRTTLELGGNDAAIVMDDVSPADVVKRLFWGAFENAGQICSGIKRLFVHERVLGPIVEGLAAIAESVKVGDGLAPDTELGPLNNAAQLARISGLVAEAIGGGAEAIAGGHRLDRAGYFFAPTILTGATDEMRIVAEEQFGPALPVLSFSDLDEAVARANATQYGLAASIWSADRERAALIARRLDVGTVWINRHAMVHPKVPFGGRKRSGIGIENGIDGLLSFTTPQVVSIGR